VNSTDRVLPNKSANTRPAALEGSDSEDLEDEQVAEPTKILEAVAAFDDVTVWGHDQVPGSDDAFLKGIEEWIAFAEAIHSPPVTQEPSNRSSD
jgi:ribonuclease H2 subunit C